MKTAIITDSNSGITQALAKELGIFVVPMPFLIDDGEYFEDINLSQADFYEKLKNNANVSTSQPIVGDLLALWDDVLKDYDEIVHIPMSSGLSKSMETARALSKDYEGKVHVVDNQRISVTQKQSVYDAIRMVKDGKTAAEIKEYLEATKSDSSIYIMVDTMKYLKKGGRVTPAAALIGTMLKLKPVLQIQGDKLDKYAIAKTLNNAKTTMIEAIRADLTGRFAEYVANGEMVLHFAHTENLAEAEKFKEQVQAQFPDIPVGWVDPLSLSVSCHIGPGALAVTLTRVLK